MVCWVQLREVLFLSCGHMVSLELLHPFLRNRLSLDNAILQGSLVSLRLRSDCNFGWDVAMNSALRQALHRGQGCYLSGSQQPQLKALPLWHSIPDRSGLMRVVDVCAVCVPALRE